MKRSFFLFLAMFIFSIHYGNTKISLYESNLKEQKVTSTVIKKVFHDRTYEVKLSVGENFLGKVTSVNIEILGNDGELYHNTLFQNREIFNKRILEILSLRNSYNSALFFKLAPPVETTGSCLSRCNAKWDCYNKPTDAGVLLCVGDCLIECANL